MSPPAAKPAVPIASNPLFKLLIWINSSLCLVTLAVMIWAAGTSDDPMPKGKERLFNADFHGASVCHTPAPDRR